MSSALRIAGVAVAGIIALWLAFQIVSVVFGIVSTIVSAIVSLLVLAAVVFLGYLLVTTVMT